MKGHRMEMVSFSLLSTNAAAERAKTVSQRRLGFTVTIAMSLLLFMGSSKGKYLLVLGIGRLKKRERNVEIPLWGFFTEGNEVRGSLGEG